MVVRILWKRGSNRWLGKSLVQNILSLYSVHAAFYILPLITIPYLTRVLGAVGWGYVAFTQAFAMTLLLLVEYGFNFSATREAARRRDSLQGRAALLQSVLGAKLILGCGVVAIALACKPFIQVFQVYPQLLWAAIACALAQGFNVMWYFQGLERMRFVATLDISIRVLLTAGVFVFIREPGDEWKYLTLQAAGSVLSTLIGLTVAYREVPAFLPGPASVRDGLKLGWSMFVFRSAECLYATGNPFLLGLFAPPQFVAYYSGAEKISKTVYGLLEPISRALYPRLSYLAQHARDEAIKTVRMGTLVMGGAGLALGLALFVSAPLVVRIMLGSEFAPAVTVLRILSVLPFSIALKNALGFHWMFPLGLDATFNRIIFTSAVLHLGLVFTLARAFHHIGMGIAVAITEVFVVIAITFALRIRSLHPWAPREAVLKHELVTVGETQ